MKKKKKKKQAAPIPHSPSTKKTFLSPQIAYSKWKKKKQLYKIIRDLLNDNTLYPLRHNAFYGNQNSLVSKFD